MPRGDHKPDEFLSIMEQEWQVFEMESLVTTERFRAEAPTAQEMVFSHYITEFAKLVGDSPEGTRIWTEWKP
jgi:hypothetical protein